MKYAIDETELARLEYLIEASESCGYSTKSDDPNMQYLAAACHYTPALVAEVRRLREKVEAWEWLFDVIEYDVYEDHPLSSRWGHDMSDKEREAYVNARVSYAQIEDAAREAVHADRE